MAKKKKLQASLNRLTYDNQKLNKQLMNMQKNMGDVVQLLDKISGGKGKKTKK